MYSIQYFSLYLIAILYIISIKVKTNEFLALSQLETTVEPKLRFGCDRLGTEPAEYGNSCGCHNRLVVSRVAATLVHGKTPCQSKVHGPPTRSIDNHQPCERLLNVEC
jgi:hypothetical protein